MEIGPLLVFGQILFWLQEEGGDGPWANFFWSLDKYNFGFNPREGIREEGEDGPWAGHADAIKGALLSGCSEDQSWKIKI